MARKPYPISKSDIKILRNRTIRTFGKAVETYGDAEQLSEKVFNKTKVVISPKTLIRVMKDNVGSHNPSKSTLDTLSAYNNYLNWATFKKLSKSDAQTHLIQSEVSILKDIYEVQVDSYIDKDLINPYLHNFSKHLIQNLVLNRHMFDSLMPIYASNRLAQYYLFEHFPYYDELANGYDQAVKLYLANKYTDESLIFGNALLFLKAYLTKDEAGLENYLGQLNKVQTSIKMHPYVLGRYYACQLLYYHSRGQESKLIELINEVYKIQVRLPIRGCHFRDFPAFQFMVMDALCHCKMWEEVLQLNQFVKANYNTEEDFIEKGYYHIISLFEAMALFHKGNQTRAQSIFKNIDPDSFYFIKRKYFTLHYLTLKQGIYPHSKSVDLKMDSLIKRTGFVKFSH